MTGLASTNVNKRRKKQMAYSTYNIYIGGVMVSMLTSIKVDNVF